MDNQIGGGYRPSGLSDVRLTTVSETSTSPAEAPSNSIWSCLGRLVGFGEFKATIASPETSKQQKAQTGSWRQSISNLFSRWFGSGSQTSNTGSNLKEARTNWVDTAQSNLGSTSSSKQETITTGKSVRSSYSKFSNSPHSPQPQERATLHDELNAVNVNDETALEGMQELEKSGGSTGILSWFMGGSRKNNNETTAQQNSACPSMVPRDSERGSFVQSTGSSPTPAIRVNKPNQHEKQQGATQKTGEALNTRGQKLTNTAENTGELRHAAGDFLKMARKLNKK